MGTEMTFFSKKKARIRDWRIELTRNLCEGEKPSEWSHGGTRNGTDLREKEDQRLKTEH
jgi:hypothetical protein